MTAPARATGRRRLWPLLWILLALPPTIIAGLLVLQETILSWLYGPQMIGFALAHSEYLIPALVCAGGLLLWLVGAVVTIAWRARTHRPRSRLLGRLALASAIILGAIAVPATWWQYVMLHTVGPGPHAAEWLGQSAAVGDLPTVRYLLDRGLAVDTLNTDSATALNGAAVGGQLAAAAYLLDHGADPNGRARDGSTPFTSAAEMKHRDVANLLLDRGARVPCPGSSRAWTEESIRQRGNDFAEIFASDDSMRRRWADATDSTVAAWAQARGKAASGCRH